MELVTVLGPQETTKFARCFFLVFFFFREGEGLGCGNEPLNSAHPVGWGNAQACI